MSNFRTGTPLQEFELPFNYEDYGKDILITYSQNNRVIIEKQRDDIRIEKNIITFTLRQEETKSFCAGVIALQIKVLDYTDNVIISDIFYTNLKEVLSGKLFVISESKLEELTATENGEYYPSENKVGFSKVTVQVADTNGSYDEGYAQGIAEGGQKFTNFINGEITSFNITAFDLQGVKKIRDYVSRENGALKSVELSDTVEEIGHSDFAGCYNLANVNLNKVKVIKSGAFQSCAGLTNVDFPETLEEIGQYAFQNSTGIENITFNNKNNFIIGNKAFSGCSSLKSLEINIEILNYEVFAYTGITSLTLGDRVKLINANAFNSCTKLSYVEIPRSVEKINNLAFLYAGQTQDKLTVKMLNETPPTLGTTPFSIDFLNKIIVPKGSRATYIASTNWSNYADYIVESEV